eukprot:TRINITY_DN9793_c0_g1_i4.p2 TRINITY_DN9793_c0_g1~~TRINITY_DN9793_c0_g1_i4.p2  ORF type:complete len:164 (-),score=25.20 TRINITY_DN9793_c0_g1_i4:167-658(-)
MYIYLLHPSLVSLFTKITKHQHYLLFFFFNDTATTEIYTLHIVGSVRCVQETGYQRRVHGDQDVDFLGIDDVFLYLQDIIDMIKDFLLLQATGFYNNKSSIQLYLFAYAMFCMCVLVAIWWYQYTKYLNSLLHQTRYIIGLFSIDMILSNPYMVALLEKIRTK